MVRVVPAPIRAMRIAATGSVSKVYKRLVIEDKKAANAGGWGILLGCYAVYLVPAFSISVRRQRREQSFSTVFSWSC